MAVRLRCPICRGTFVWDIVNSGFPDDCKVCGEHIGHDRADDDIVMPSIRDARSVMQRTDQVYRDIERGSEIRAQIAAEQVGATPAEMSGIKITDLRPTTQPGSSAATTRSPGGCRRRRCAGFSRVLASGSASTR